MNVLDLKNLELGGTMTTIPNTHTIEEITTTAESLLFVTNLIELQLQRQPCSWILECRLHGYCNSLQIKALPLETNKIASFRSWTECCCLSVMLDRALSIGWILMVYLWSFRAPVWLACRLFH